MGNLETAMKLIEAMNNHDAESMGSLYCEDAEALEIAEGTPVKGRRGIVKAYEELFSAFPDCKATVKNAFAGNEGALIEVLWEGTNRGEFRGTPATGRKISLMIAYVLFFKEGKIKEIHEYYDAYTYMKQSGLL